MPFVVGLISFTRLSFIYFWVSVMGLKNLDRPSSRCALIFPWPSRFHMKLFEMFFFIFRNPLTIKSLFFGYLQERLFCNMIKINAIFNAFWFKSVYWRWLTFFVHARFGFVSESIKLSGGLSSGRKPRVEARSAERVRGLDRGVPSDGGPGGITLGKCWNLRRNLVHFGKKLTFLQFSTFVNENIAVVLDSGIDIVAYSCNFSVVWMPSVSCSCSRM